MRCKVFQRCSQANSFYYIILPLTHCDRRFKSLLSATEETVFQFLMVAMNKFHSCQL